MAEVHQQLKLGKKLGHVEDPRTFKFKAFLPRKLPTPPKSSNVGAKEEIRMYANDQYGNCAFASMGHRIDVQERSSRQTEIQLTDNDLLRGYSDVTGFNPDNPATDNGTYMLDALNYFRRVGLGRETDGTPHQIGAYAQLSPHVSRAEWQVAAWMFGGVYVGAWLPWDAGNQLAEGKKWEVLEGPDAEPGSWGGHAMWMTGFADKTVTLATWGQRQKATWDWLGRYVDEAYVIISEDYLNRSGKTPQGFNADKLQEALEQL